MSNLDLVLPPTLARGGTKPPKEISMYVSRPVGVDDLWMIFNGESGGSFKPLQRIRAVHHNIAILLSQGKGPEEISRITGRTPSGIRLLQKDPAFRNLLSHYMSAGEQARADMLQQLGDLGQAAIAALQEDLETNPDGFDVKDKIRIVEMTMDRTGHGPTKTVKNLNTADAIRELVKEKEKAQRGKVIDMDAA